MAITISAAAKAPASANTAQAGADPTQQSGAGADLFASLLGVELGQLDTGTSGTGAKLAAAPAQGAKAAKSDKPEVQSTTLVDPATLAMLQGAVAPVPVVANNNQVDAGVTQSDGSVQVANVGAAKAGDDAGLLLGVQFKKAESLQKLPLDASAVAQFLPLDQPVVANAGHNNGSAPLVLTVQTPIQDPNWGKAFGDQLMGMVSLKADTAHIQVNPAQLGPIDVTLKIDNNNQAQISFVTSNPMAREVVEQNLPRLTSMLQASGINLTGAQVSTGQGQHQQAFAQQQQRGQKADQDDEPDALTAIRAARGVLSIFA